VKVGADTEPAGVPAVIDAADPLIVSAGTVPWVPLNAGTPAGQETTWAGTVPGEPLNAWAGTVPVDPVKAWAGTVPGEPENVGAPAGHENAGALHAAPEKLGAETVPVGVPPLTKLEVAASPANVGAETPPAGVTESAPPVVPTSAFAATVTLIMWPASAVTSV
jgi:hypothetical protein